MFKKLALLLSLFLGISQAAVSSVSLPLDWTGAAGISRSNLNLNPIALRDGLNTAIDSLNPILAAITGYSNALTLASNQDLVLKVDVDANGSNRLVVTGNNLDSLFRVAEDKTARLFGHLTIDSNLTARRVTAADSIVGTSERLTGSLAAANGSFSGTLGVTGVQTNSAALTFNNTGTAADWSIWRSAGAGLAIRGGAGSSYDFSLFNPAAQYLIRNPTGTQGLEFPGSGTYAFTGPVTAASTLGVTGNLSVGAGTGAPSIILNGAAANGRQMVWQTAGISRWGWRAGTVAETGSDAGTEFALRAYSDAGAQIDDPISIVRATGGAITLARPVTMSSTATTTGVHTFTAAPVFSSVTASQILSVNGSKALTSTATTGTGSVMLAASPTTTGTLTAAAITASGTVTADTLISPKFYDEGSFTGAWTGFSSGAGTPTVNYVRVGKQVTLRIPAVSGTSNATTFTLTGIPAGLRPSSSFTGVAVTSAQDNGSAGAVIYASVTTTGVVNFNWNGNASGWTASGAKGLILFTFISYTLQ